MNTPASRSPAVARWLLALTAVGITYGSLYPFHFTPAWVSPEKIVSTLLSGWQDEFGIPNVFSNIVLFLPYGLFGVLAFPHLSKGLRSFVILASGAILAFGIQVVQIWFSGRIPTVTDGIINMGGVLIGMTIALAAPIRSVLSELDLKTEHLQTLPLLLLLTWLAYRWFPFVPSLDVAMLKEGLKPLFLHREWRPLNFAHNLVAWLVFACLWRRCQFRESLLWLLIPGSLVVQVVIADNPVLLHNIVAAIAAPPLWFVCRRVFRQPEWPLLILLVGVLVMQGLRPFEIAPSSFKWIPFSGFLSGNMMVNTSSLLEKLFLYGSLVWLTLDVTRSRIASLLLPMAITGIIEIAQIGLAGRVAEITDPLLCALIWMVAVMERSGENRPDEDTGEDQSVRSPFSRRASRSL